MDGIHDMGGMHGFGKVEPEPNEPVFHSEWEGRALALNRAMGYTGIWTIDQTRYGIERLPPELYLSASYYKKWAIRLEKLVVEMGLADADEIEAGHALRPGKKLKRKLTAAEVPNTLSRGSFARATNTQARFKPSDRVRTKCRDSTCSHGKLLLAIGRKSDASSKLEILSSDVRCWHATELEQL